MGVGYRHCNNDDTGGVRMLGRVFGEKDCEGCKRLSTVRSRWLSILWLQLMVWRRAVM